jgi:hypothetical protein
MSVWGRGRGSQGRSVDVPEGEGASNKAQLAQAPSTPPAPAPTAPAARAHRLLPAEAHASHRRGRRRAAAARRAAALQLLRQLLPAAAFRDGV